MKKESRFLSITDTNFKKTDQSVMLVGVISLGGGSLEGVLSTRAEIDGDDATDQIIAMIQGSKHKSQLKTIFLGGLSVGGFNVIDLAKLFKETGIPVIVIMKHYPDLEKIINTLHKLELSEKVILFEKAGEIYPFYDELYYQVCGIDKDVAKGMLNIACTNSYQPEGLRLARIIGSGIINGLE